MAIRSMVDYSDAGFTTWDLADHYGPAEDFIGEFRDANWLLFAVRTHCPVSRLSPSGCLGPVQ